MKTKHLTIGITVVLALGTMSFACINWNDEPACANEPANTETKSVETEQSTDPGFKNRTFHLSMRSRFREMKRSNILMANSLPELMDLPELKEVVKLKAMVLETIENDEPSGQLLMGNSLKFTKQQKAMLDNAALSSNFKIQVDYEKKDPFSDELITEYSSPYFTVVPEKMAEYEGGSAALVDYMRNASYSETILLNGKGVNPAKFKFTVTKTGQLSDITLDTSCGFPFIDQMLMSLIKQAPGKWSPAIDMNGEAVDQEYFFFFGEMGC